MKLWPLLTCLLAACGGGGGGGGGGEVVDPRVSLLNSYDGIVSRVAGDPDRGLPGMAPAPAAAFTLRGIVLYEGTAALVIEGADPRILRGASSLLVDFETSTGNGTIDGVFRIANGVPTADYDGALTLTLEGLRAGTDGLIVAYGGTLAGEGVTYGFDGLMTGEILGDDAEALMAVDYDAEIVSGGRLLDGIVLLVAEEVR